MNDLSWVLPYRTDALTVFFKLISYSAEEWFLMAFVAIGYWCCDKKFFRDLIVMICISTLLNILLKGVFQVPRPTIPHLMSGHDTYSFPSGHAQATTVLWLLIAMHYKQAFFWCLGIFMILAQCLSRVYLGVHFPSDVAAGVAVGSILVLGYQFYDNSRFPKLFACSPWIVLVLFSLGLALYYFFTMNSINKNSLISGAALLGVVVGYLFEHRFCHYQIPVRYGVKIAVALFGLISLFGLRYLLKAFVPGSYTLLYIFFMYFVLAVYMIYLIPAIIKKVHYKKSIDQ